MQLMLAESAARPFSGEVLTLGRQHVYCTWRDFQHYATAVNVRLADGITPEVHRAPALRSQGFLSDETVFKALGFSHLVRADVSNYEDVDEIFDLNQADPPVHLRNRFDLILDTGTLEHVFDAPQVLANLHAMLKTSGRIIHLSPTANCIDHGFYSFSPTFFADYYQANRYSLHRVLLCRYLDDTVNSPVECYDYFRRTGMPFENGTVDRKVYYTWVVAQRGDQSTCGAIPQQSFYVTHWPSSLANEPATDWSAQEPQGTKADRLLRLTKRVPLLNRFAKWSIATWRSRIHRMRKRFRFPLEKVGEYR